jgi:spermidine/putrescine-binding protein
MKKIVLFVLVGLLPFGFLACQKDEEIIYLLNWGEYINEELVLEFTDQTGIIVDITTVDSNEAMLEAYETRNSPYDIMIPSDYMIEKMYDSGYLQEIDQTKLTNFAEANFMGGVNEILDQLFLDNTTTVSSAYEVAIPYFWGLFGLMYNKELPDIETYLETNGWNAVFGPIPARMAGWTADPAVGVYSVPRFAYSASLLYAEQEGLASADALNVFSAANLVLSEDILGDRAYTDWATDMLKQNIDNGSLDIAFTYVGDFFDTYLINADAAGATTGAEAEAANSHMGIYIPDHTMAFVDCMVIPIDAENVENAHTFIDFFLNPENAYENSGIVGYTTTLIATYEMILNADKGDFVRQTMVQNHPYNPEQITNRIIVGTPLLPFSDEDSSAIDAMLVRIHA